MAVAESVHYPAGADDEWWYERGFGSGGAGRMGADNRTFTVSIYQQEHCLLYLHGQLTNRTSKNRSPHHQYYLNYLRQQALCHPDLTLEQETLQGATLGWIGPGRHTRVATSKLPGTTMRGTG